MNNEEELNQRKNKLRKEILDHRSKIDIASKADYDSWVCNQLYDLVQEWDYQVIHTYIPMGDEIDVLPLIDKLIFYKWTTSLRCGPFFILINVKL